MKLTGKILVVVGGIFLCAAVIAPAHGEPEAPAARKAEKRAAARSVTFSVPSITCPLCERNIREALRGFPGIGKIDVDIDKKTARMAVTDTALNTDEIILKIQEAGYVSEVVSAVWIFRMDHRRGYVDWEDIRDAIRTVHGVRKVAVSLASPSAGHRHVFFAIEIELGRATEGEIKEALDKFRYPYKKVY